MQVQKILHKELSSFLESDAYKKSQYLPISRIRGLSHACNPRALPDDLVLVMVFDDGEMQGYLGILPDDLYFRTTENDYQKEHAGWLSCMWVNPQLRGKGIAKLLINTVFESWEYRILVTEFTAAAKGLYDRTEQFTDLAKPQGIRAYMRLNLHYLLPAKNPQKWTKFTTLLSLADGIFNLFNGIRLKFTAIPKSDYSFIPEIDAEAWDFIQKHRSPDELMRRDFEDLNWILANPWLQSGFEETAASKRYHFSSVAKYFSFKALKIFNAHQEIAAILIVSIRDKNLKIPYCYVQAGSEDLVLNFIEKLMREQRLDMLTVFQQSIINQIKKNGKSFFIKRTFQRHYILSKIFEKKLIKQPSVVIQDGDADVAFT